MKRSSRYQKQKLGLLPFGQVAIGRLSMDQAIFLDKLARKWGCETLSEAAEEILRDALEELSDVQNRK